MIVAHRIALDSTDNQREYFKRAAGVSRFTWNVAIDECERRLAIGRDRFERNKALRKAGKCSEIEKIPDDEQISSISMGKAFNEFRNDAFPWMQKTHRDCYSQPFAYAERAYMAYFRDPKNTGRPKLKKKGRCRDSFYVANDQIRVDGRRIRLPRIGWVKMREELRFSGKIISATVSRTADLWFVSIHVDVGDECEKRRSGDGIVGADVGIKSAVALSTGETINAPKPLKRALKNLKRIQRKQSRQTLGGKNRTKTNKKIARAHARCANIRKDFWHKITTRLCRENQAIGIETLNIEGMKSNRKLARAIYDVAPGMMARILEYKVKIYDCVLHKTDMWFASSKTCSCCGHVKPELDLSVRVFRCEACGFVCDRDVNAAKNEKNELVKFLAQAKKDTGGSPEVRVHACGLEQGMAPRKAGTTMLATRQQIPQQCGSEREQMINKPASSFKVIL